MEAESEQFTYYRPVRAYPRPVPDAEVVVAAPPPLTLGGAAGWLPYLLPLASSVGSIGLLLAVPGRKSLGLVAAVAGMVVVSVVLGLLMHALQRRASRRAKRHERERYLAYLEDIRHQLSGVAARQREAAAWCFPDLAWIWSLVARRERLWERRPSDDDFLSVRIGRGTVPLGCRVRLEPGGPLAQHDPELLAAAQHLVEDAARLPDMPLVVPLRRSGVVAVTGAHERARPLLCSLLVQLAAFHAPDELQIIAAFPPAARAAWDWLKWLPHIREPAPDHGSAAATLPACRLAETPAQLADLLERHLQPRLAQLARHADAPPPGGIMPRTQGAEPRLLVVLDGYSPRGELARLPLVQELLERAGDVGVTVLCLAQGRAAEPSQLQVRIELDDDVLSLQEAVAGGQRFDGIAPDQGGLAFCEAVARLLAPLRLERSGATAPLPSRLRLLDLLGIRDVNPMLTWRQRSRDALLRVPIGQCPGGDVALLDLKEAADGGMGPHGLIIGATGAGKSELLRTIVTGLAIGHPPELLSFVLVDFKGGAAFAALAPLPHSAGMITNLQDDLTMVDRMRAALQGEMERRQRLLRQAGNLDGIKRYRAAARSDPSLPPMPYLLVIVDEFGELLTHRPEFLDLFVAVGRLGRSLGIHLLLASQRLDESRIRGLEGYLRYRICLRTFSAAESVAVLGNSDAYLLPAMPGSALLQVDTEIYLRFKSALVSLEQPKTPPGASAPVLLPFEPAPPQRPPGTVSKLSDDDAGPAATDMSVAVAALAAASPAVHQVWLPPLPPALPLGQVLELAGRGRAGAAEPIRGPDDAGWLRLPVGIVDKPVEQTQEALLLDFSGATGHLALVGAPRSGKSTLLATIAAGFALTHPPDVVQLYCIDFGGGLLHQLAVLPGVGAVCGKQDRDEIRAMVRQLRTVVAEREQRFRRRGLDSMAAWHRRRLQRGTVRGTQGDDAGCGDAYGEVFLVIDNWGLLRQELEDLEPQIGALAATGLHYGVHLIVAANRWNDLRPALRDNLGGRLELRLNDPLESVFGRHAAAALPERIPGRGLVDGGPAGGLQFQAALPRLDAAARNAELADALGELAEQALRTPDGAAAPPLRVLPALVPIGDLPALAPDSGGGAVPPAGVPFGIGEHHLEPVWLDLLAAPHFLIFGDAECGKTSLLRCLTIQLTARYRPDEVQLVLVDFRRTLLDVADLAGPHLLGYACSATMAAEAAARVRELAAPRLPSASISASAGPAPAAPAQPGLPRQQRWSWSGPHVALLVDDYDLLLTPGGNPLASLLDLIGQGRDVGLHVICARTVSGTTRASFEPVSQRLRELGSPGLIMSGDPQEGPLLGGYRAGSLPAGRGLLVRRQGQGASGLVQVAFAPVPTLTTLDQRRR